MTSTAKKINAIFEMTNPAAKYRTLERLSEEDHDAYCGEWLRRNPVDLRSIVDTMNVCMVRMSDTFDTTYYNNSATSCHKTPNLF